jgi:hypothetical protein
MRFLTQYNLYYSYKFDNDIIIRKQFVLVNNRAQKNDMAWVLPCTSASGREKEADMSERIAPENLPPDILRRLLKAASGLEYGTITLVFHEGRVIQIERNEKLRLPAPKPRR